MSIQEAKQYLESEKPTMMNRGAVAWMVEDYIVIREDFAAILGWNGATVGTGRAIPHSWTPMLYALAECR